MDWLSSIVTIEKVISLAGKIFNFLKVVYSWFQRYVLKKTEGRTQITEPKKAHTSEELKSTNTVDSPGTINVDGDCKISHSTIHTGDIHQHFFDDSKAQLFQIGPVTQQALNSQAEHELSKILLLRVFDPLEARQNIQDLNCRVDSEGDLFAVSSSIKLKVHYWTARLCATDIETLTLAKKLCKKLHHTRQSDPDLNLHIIDALISETAGDADTALRLLRDRKDPDSRTVIFVVLAKSQGGRAAVSWFEQQNDCYDYKFCTAVGWANWASHMSKLGKWEEAASRLLTLGSLWPDMPALAFVEGHINAAMLVPDEFKSMTLDGVPLYQGISPSQKVKAKHYHARAETCFKFMKRSARDIDNQRLTKAVADWLCWLRLMNPDTIKANAAREELRQQMEEGARAVELIHFAFAFNILFSVEPLKQFLEQRKLLGGLNDLELQAECLLAIQSMSPRNLVSYLEQHKARLSNVMHPVFLITIFVDALVRDNQTERARVLVSESASDLSKAHLSRLTAKIEMQEGIDPRKHLEALYDQTKSLVDLQNLVTYFKDVGDRAALLPLVHELFKQVPTAERALDVVQCLSSPPSSDYESVLSFLEDNPDILKLSDDLKTAKAWALFQAGRFQESREINDSLLNQKKKNQDALHLDINIAICSGDWERVTAIINREWDTRNSLDPDTVMTLAQLASQQDKVPKRALQLARLATDKAPNDPRVLAAAYWLHYQLGYDHEADPEWLQRASVLSSTEEGPLWYANFPEIVTKWIPERRNHMWEVEQKWLSGEIPVGLAASSLNVPLAHLLLHVPDQNISKPGNCHRTILPIIAGGRNSIELQDDWTIGLDVTSTMILTHLDLLEIMMDRLHHVMLAPDIMELLFRERDEVRFHQPSRIEAAKQMVTLRNRGQLRVIEKLATPTQSIIAEVGHELAALLQTARENDGKVICVLPIHKAESLTLQHADTRTYDDLIHSLVDFCELLHEEGKIGTADYQHAMLFFNSQAQAKRTSLLPSFLDGPIYMDRLALSYLQYAKVLQPIATVGLDIRVHSNYFDEMHALIEAGDAGENLINKIEKIRSILRNRVDSGTVSFLPYISDLDEQTRNREIRFRTTASLLTGSDLCDALCIDDRYINSHPVMTGPSEQSVPIVCVVDLLHYLFSHKHINIDEYWLSRHKLRQSGFAFIPLETKELVYWLKKSKVEGGQVTESMELQVIRQTVARTLSLNLTSPTEAPALSMNISNSCQQAIASLWQDKSLTPEQAMALSDWVWSSMMTTAIFGRQHLAQDVYTNRIREVISYCLMGLFMPLNFQSNEHRTHYTNWIEQFILRPLQPANSDVIKQAITSSRDVILGLKNDQWQAYGSFFLEQLPEAARELVMTQNADFATQCGFKMRQVLEIGPGIKLASNKLFETANEVFDTNGKRLIQDLSGKELLIFLGPESQNIVVKWKNAEEAPYEIQIPGLALLSPDREARLAELESLIGRLGPISKDLRGLHKVASSRKLNQQELSTIFGEFADSVVALEDSLVEKLRDGDSLNISDIGLRSILYFEKFAGPIPDKQEPESYFKEQLIPYRKALLNQNLEAGLNICCIGALHDDLSPGQWVENIDNDTVWNALETCHVKSNPFSILGALDIALYRQEDPRFQQFAKEAVIKLSDKSFQQQDNLDTYKLLHVSADFVLNRINLLENGSSCPSYWKRMCAWMQAGLIVRAFKRSSVSLDVENFQRWTHNNMPAAGFYAELVSARKEPMLSAASTPQSLRHEILSRLYALKIRHDGEGRKVPWPEDINHLFDQYKGQGQSHTLNLPGILERHKRPTVPITEEFTQNLERTRTEATTRIFLESLAIASQIFILSESELDFAREAVRTLAEKIRADAEMQENLECLQMVSVIAAASRDTALADEVLDVLVSVVPSVSSREQITTILLIVLQTAGVHEMHEPWFDWLEERLARIATQLTLPPHRLLEIFLCQLDEMQVILPMESWFHIRAKCIALACVEV